MFAGSSGMHSHAWQRSLGVGIEISRYWEGFGLHTYPISSFTPKQAWCQYDFQLDALTKFSLLGLNLRTFSMNTKYDHFDLKSLFRKFM